MANWALVVGINTYHEKSGQPELKGAVADACDFAEWALDPAGGNVAPECLYFWAHPWPDAATGRLKDYLAGEMPKWDHEDHDWSLADTTQAPKARDIVRTAERIGRELREAAFGSANPQKHRILVHLAGHGLRTTEVGDKLLQTCFVARDFRPETGGPVAAGLIPCTSFRRALRHERFDEVLMFLDCCRNDSTAYSTLEALPICDYRAERQVKGWGVGHASADNERAYETTTEPVRGAFSQTLMNGLRSSRDANGILCVEDLEKYVHENIGKATNTGQSPQFDCDPKNRSMIVVEGAAAAGLGPVIRFNGLPLGSRVFLRDGRGNAVPGVEPLIVSNDPMTLPTLEAGLYSLEPEHDPGREALFKYPRDQHVEVG